VDFRSDRYSGDNSNKNGIDDAHITAVDICVIKALLPSGLIATPKGPSPTGIVFIAVSVSISITETVSLQKFVI
jgi:hypothetical protein